MNQGVEQPRSSQRISEFVENLDAAGVVLDYDIHSDRPFQHDQAIGALRMAGAYRAPRDGVSALLVGAFWCDMVRADVEYQLSDGMRLVAESRKHAETLKAAVLGTSDGASEPPGDDLLSGYACARWFDGAGKLNYRVGNFARARMDFAVAVAVATARGLRWCLPDLTSNLRRSELEEARQSNQDGDQGSDLRQLRVLIQHIRDLRAALAEYGPDAVRIVQQAGKALAPDYDPAAADAAGLLVPSTRDREFVRGYSSLLHNLSVALQSAAGAKPAPWAIPGLITDGLGPDATATLEDCLELSRAASTISSAMKDDYRLGQALLHQAQILDDDTSTQDQAAALYRRVQESGWVRGQRLAKQNHAAMIGGEEGRKQLRDLLNDFRQDSVRVGHQAGLDLDFGNFTVRRYHEVIKSSKDLNEKTRPALEAEVRVERRLMAETVRQVIALPAYKQAYAKAVYPVFQEQIARIVTGEEDKGVETITRNERILGLYEECAARSLLDLMASAALPALAATPVAPAEEIAPAGSGRGSTGLDPVEPENPDSVTRPPRRRPQGRRGSPLLARRVQDSRLPLVLRSRQQEFENAFRSAPLGAIPHDEDIAHKLNMLTANEPGCCVLRYLSYAAPGGARGWAALIAHGGRQKLVTFTTEAVERLLKRAGNRDTAPSDIECQMMWHSLIRPVYAGIKNAWEALGIDVQHRHLIVVPSDELFNVPFHVATEKPWITPPLGALVPMSYSASVTALITRGRHLLKVQPVDVTDDLAAVVSLDLALNGTQQDAVSGREIVDVGWPAEFTHVLGDRPPGIDPRVHQLPSGWDGLAEIARLQPEFFAFAGHGEYEPGFAEFGPALQLPRTPPVETRGSTAAEQVPQDYLTSFDAALRLRLPRNRLTLLGACLAGRGSPIGGGDVGGFLRALMAAGAGAIGLPLWSIFDTEMVTAGRHLLRSSREAATHGSFDVVVSLHRYYEEQFAAVEGRAPKSGDAVQLTFADHFPLALYL